MFSLGNYSIKLRLYALMILSTVGLAAVLSLALYVLATYRVNGPIYNDIRLAQNLEEDFSPPVLYALEPYVTLQEMESASEAELPELRSRFARQVNQYRDNRKDWLKKLPEGNLKTQFDGASNQPVEDMIQIANDEYIPQVIEAAKTSPDKANTLKGAELEKYNKMRETVSDTLRKKLTPLFRKHRDAVEKKSLEIKGLVEVQEKAARISTDFWINVIWVISVASIVIGGVVGWITLRGIIRTTGLLLVRVKELSSGASDLTARIPVESKDELGQLAEGINATIEKIRVVVARVRESSIQLLSTASQIAATAREQGTTVQGLSSSTAEVAAAVREITATSRELSGTMNEVNTRATQAASLAASGRQRLVGMEATMAQLVDSTAQISGKLASIREKADSINVVVTTITKVADQTNLLSINAAIEAEKAGEYGRGFLVVAREIRRLADQTAVATLDIENMVRHMQEAVTTGVMQMDKFSDEVKSGVGKVAEINGQTGQIIEEVHALTDRYHQVNESMRNQTIGAEQINEAMASMTSNIRETASALDEFNRATAHLRSSVEMLNQEVTQFRI